jgi:hypothetical protein
MVAIESSAIIMLASWAAIIKSAKRRTHAPGELDIDRRFQIPAKRI